MEKKLLASLLALGMVLAMLPTAAWAAEEMTNLTAACTITEGCIFADGHEGVCTTSGSEQQPIFLREDTPVLSGTCGDPAVNDGKDVAWALTQNNAQNETSTYTLTISGTGAMADYNTANSGQPWSTYLSTITKIIIKSGITSIGDFAFMNAENVLSVILPEGLSRIGQRGFANCKKLASPTFPSTLKEIGSNPFYDCDGFTSIVLPNSLTTMGTMLFLECSNLVSITFPRNSTATVIPEEFVKSCSNLRSFIIPDTVTAIGQAAFAYSGIEMIDVPSSVSSIGASAFYHCGALKEIRFYADNVTLSSAVFINCSALQHVIFDSGDIVPYNENNAYIFLGLADGSIIYVKGNPTQDTITKISNAIKDNTAVAITNGGTFADDITFTAGTLATPVKHGYAFVGWYDNTEFTGLTVTMPIAGNIYYAKWIELKANDISLQYGGTQDVPAIAGVTLSDWQSSNTSVVTVTGGKLTATGTGTTTITATASTAGGGTGTLIVNVTVTPRVLTVDYKQSSEGTGSLTYTVSAEPQTHEGYIAFEWKDDSGEAVTLSPDTQITYTYKDTGDTEPRGYSLLPGDAGEYTAQNGNPVIFTLSDGNYIFDVDGELSASFSVNVTVAEERLTPTFLSALFPMANTDFVYDSAGKLPVTGILKAYGVLSETNDPITDIAEFTVSITGIEENPYNSRATIPAGTDASVWQIALPRDVGSYKLSMYGVGESHYLYKTLNFTIAKVPLAVTADNKSMTVNGTLPELTYTVTGLAKGEALTAEPTLTCTADGKTVGTYPITISGATASNNYTVTHVSGILTVYASSYGDGSGSNTTTKTTNNPDGSKTTTVTDKKTGVVTTTQTWPNGVKVVTVNKPGENTTASVTVPTGVGSAVVTIPTKNVTLGTVAVNAKTGEIIKLCVPGENGLTVKLDGSADFILKDNSKTFSDVPANGWAADAITFVTAREIFSGTGEASFTPGGDMTRAMLTTVLARLDGQDTTGGESWYAQGMVWATTKGITDGTNPEGSITREQLVAMLYRYAGSPAVSGMALSEFPDAAQVSDWAADAMRWAVSTKLISGTDNGTLNPGGNATRAEVATILMRYCEQ